MRDFEEQALTGEEEMQLQYSFIQKAKEYVKQAAEEKKRPLTYHVVTFGCQMNARDSEKLSGILEEIGYTESDTEQADFILFNTCTVRENADNRLFGRLGNLSNYKKKNPDVRIALCGCMMQEPSAVEKIKKSYRYVNLIFGTHNIYKFAELICRCFEEDSLVIDIWKDTDKIVENLPNKRKYPFKSGVNIMFGCNNFCSYCIVPYVRGRERSREPKEILREIAHLASDGVREVMLLGQNVNSYGKNLYTPMSFSDLLREVNEIRGIERIRFMTSHPKDLSDDLIAAIRDCKKICQHLHLPVQSGSSAILKKMNRHYSREQYLSLVSKVRQSIPDIALTTDIIVGFPGETEADFEATLELVREVRFDNAFTFLYSRRSGTPAATMENPVPETVMKERFERLLQEVQAISAQKAQSLCHKVVPVMAEEVNSQDSHLLTGRLDNNAVVHFPGTPDLIGKILQVSLEECKGFYYLGQIVPT